MRNKSVDTNYEADFRVIEWLKAELVESIGMLFKSLLKTGGEATADALAAIVINCYVLGKRLAINYQTIDMHIMHKINSTVNEAPELEHMYGDLTELKKYLDRRESKTR
ncbi:MAG TPA: MazG-like family protein [Syntrophomonas sp.]|nr:MazG-like family protein [Syntrophomonas sp.]